MIDAHESGAIPPDVANAMEPQRDQTFWMDFERALAGRFQELICDPELQKAAAQFAASFKSRMDSSHPPDLHDKNVLGRFSKHGYFVGHYKDLPFLQQALKNPQYPNDLEDVHHRDYVLSRAAENVSESAVVAYLIFKELNRDVAPQPVQAFKERGIGVYHSMSAFISKDIVSLETILSARSPIVLSGYTGASNPNGKNETHGELYIEPTDDAEVTYIGRGDVYSHYYPNGERAPSRGNLISRTLEDVTLGEVTEVFLRLRSDQVKSVHLVGYAQQQALLERLIGVCQKYETPLIKHTQPHPNRYWEIGNAVSDIEYVDIYAEDPYGDPVRPHAEQGHAKLKELGTDYQSAKQYLAQAKEEFNEDYYQENTQLVPS